MDVLRTTSIEQSREDIEDPEFQLKRGRGEPALDYSR